MPLAQDISASLLDDLKAHATRLGVSIVEVWEEPEGGRFIGTFEGHEMRLFPKYDSHLAMYFTVAHLYGHMVQIARQSPISKRADFLIAPGTRTFTVDEVQRIFDHEYEAAAIGRRLMAETGPIAADLDAQYSRIFFADFHYLINCLETGEGTPAAFERYWRREPVPARLVEADPQPLVDLSKYTAPARREVVVV